MSFLQASAKPVESNVNAESGGSSNSSSSESDSDLEDEEVARLNASLIEQTTEQNKALDARPESSSSFNLCKYEFILNSLFPSFQNFIQWNLYYCNWHSVQRIPLYNVKYSKFRTSGPQHLSFRYLLNTNRKVNTMEYNSEYKLNNKNKLCTTDNSCKNLCIMSKEQITYYDQGNLSIILLGTENSNGRKQNYTSSQNHTVLIKLNLPLKSTYCIFLLNNLK